MRSSDQVTAKAFFHKSARKGKKYFFTFFDARIRLFWGTLNSEKPLVDWDDASSALEAERSSAQVLQRSSNRVLERSSTRALERSSARALERFSARTLER